MDKPFVGEMVGTARLRKKPLFLGTPPLPPLILILGDPLMLPMEVKDVLPIPPSQLVRLLPPTHRRMNRIHTNK